MVGTTSALLSLIGGNAQFSKGVQVFLTLSKENMLTTIPCHDLLSAAVEMQAQALVLTRLAADKGNQQLAKEISRLEHELGEASSSLKSSLEVVSAFES